MRIGTPGFIGARLTEAREVRGIAQTELGELTGLKPQSICHYEQGRQSPSPEALTLLSDTLHLPERYFLRPLPPQRQGPLFPCTRATSRAERSMAEHRLGWLSELTRYLAEYVEFPALRIPSAVLPGIAPQAISADDIEFAATAARSFFLSGSGPIPSMTTLLENHGFILTAWSATDDGCGGYLQCRDGVPCLALSWHHPGKTQVCAAHALGHLILHATVTQDQVNDPHLHEQLEHQADHFARAFLLPARSFGKEVWAPTIDALLALKRTWNCPVSVMVRRCGDLGIFDAEQVRRAFANIARRGWKNDEPMEHSEAPASEGLLARSVRLLLDAGIKDGHTLMAELALPSADIEDLAGLPKGTLRNVENVVPIVPRLRQAV